MAGKHVCLKAGQQCRTALDRTYHRYRFHCHRGRLTRFPPPPPSPPVTTTPAPNPEPPPVLADPPPPTGSLVDVGGYRLMLECVGSGSPTILYESGASGTRWGVRKVQYALSADTRVCSYDRPNAEGSQSDQRPASVVPTSERFAQELRTLLTSAGEPGPYLLVGGSFGGILNAVFTLHHPDLVAGLVFVDSFSPNAAELEMKLVIREGWNVRADLEALKVLQFGSRPLVVLQTDYLNEGSDFRRRSTNIIVADASQYSHDVAGEAPGLVYETIRVAVGAIRSGGALPACASTPLARLVERCA